MDMKDCLAGIAIGVEDRSVAARRQAAFAGDSGRPPHQFADEPVVLGAELVERRDMPFRYDQHVGRRLRVDVVEGDDAIVLVDQRRGNLTPDDFAEQAVGHTPIILTS